MNLVNIFFCVCAHPVRAPRVVGVIHLMSRREGSLPHYQRRLAFNLNILAPCHGEALIAETDRYKSEFHKLSISAPLTPRLCEIAAV